MPNPSPKPLGSKRRPGPGRPKGLTRQQKQAQRDADSLKALTQAAAAIHDAGWTGPSPLAVLSSIAHNKKLEPSLRERAASSAAPYIHPKQPQAIHVTEQVKLERVTVVVIGGPRAMLPAKAEGLPEANQ